VVALLDADPDLGEHLAGPRLAEARRECLGRRVTIEEGPWPDRLGHLGPRDLGVLVLSGMGLWIARTGRYHGSELVGPGDLLRPWDLPDELDVTPTHWELRVLSEMEAVVLDGTAARRIGRYPELVSALLSRGKRRTRLLVASLATAQAPRVDRRVLLALWRMAGRWGRVTPEGVLVELPLTHEMLGWMVAARRPAVTSAVGQLEREGRLRRPGPHVWLLTGHAPYWLEAATNEATWP
jgi:CRP-like cAMP-binding protein